MSEVGGEGVALVTGASSGIGIPIARAVAASGRTVLAVGRNPEKTRHVVDELRRETGNQRIEALVFDLATDHGRRALIAAVRARANRLSLLVNNAGQANRARVVTEDGLESTFAVNHLAYFQVTLGLLDLLRAAAPSRVVVTASDAHRGAVLDLADLQMQKSFSGWKAYQRSKLANILFTYEAARRWQGMGVTINAFHPGLVGTGIVRELPWPLTAVWKMVSQSPDDGARGGIHLALSPEVEGVTGRYFVGTKERASSPESLDPDNARLLWEESLRLIGGAP